ncbi:hypothetical protein P3F83_01710 [Mycobacteroides immunogenum]|uniref:hypothetical protein n=1 Tax=Mycobacteroides immunogenum TaxID=83262 RepID=UPI0025B738C0|nr:hypothetical protein [Mycobacteroides immunogenum]WJR34191.1 hypothetical protein P3F83_01710 [Mycobacteroides immunogenum]
MADISDLHPAVIHALKTGSLDQAIAASGRNATVDGSARRVQNHPTTPGAHKLAYQPADLDDDDFYGRYNTDPFGLRT